MPNVIFAVPYALDTTVRFVRGAASLPGVRLGILSQEPLERLPEDLRRGASAYERLKDALDAGQIAEGVRAIARRWGGEVDALVGILEQMQEPLAEVRERLGIPGMDVETARNFRDKARMKDLLRASDLPCARHALAESAQAALTFAEDCGYPLVVKPPAGAGAVNTCRVDSREQLEGYLRTLPPRAGAPVLLEEFITGQEFSFDSVSVDGRHVFHSITRYFPTPLEVMENPFLQWAVMLPRRIDGPEYEPIRDAGPRVLDVLGMRTGLTHMEWFRRADGSIAISEVAARPPGAQFTTLLSYAHDRDFYRAWGQLVSTGTFDVPERRFAAGAVFLRGQGSGRVVGVHGVEEAQRELAELVVEARLPRVGQPRASSYEGEGYVILRHPETEKVEAGLRRLVGLLRVELGQETP